MSDATQGQSIGEIVQYLLQQHAASQAQLQEQIQANIARMEALSSKPVAARRAAPATYNGTLEEDLELWIFMIEQYYADYYPLMQEDSAAFVTMVSCHFGSTVMNWYRQFSLDCERNGIAKSWTVVTNGLRKRFLPPDFEYMLREKLYNLEQKGSLHDYVSAFQDVLVQCRLPISPLELRFYFQSGLRAETAVHLRENHPETLEESIDIAMRYDHPSARSAARPATRPAATTDWVKSATCHRCKQVGHLSSDCPTK
jgi:hypothetical protein